ncbi:hypothetical protein ACV35O_35600, partial [Pseudomonas aeruginosa]
HRLQAQFEQAVAPWARQRAVGFRQAPAYGQQIAILQGVEIGRPPRMYARAEGAGERVSTVEVPGNGAAFAEGRAYL